MENSRSREAKVAGTERRRNSEALGALAGWDFSLYSKPGEGVRVEC